MLREFGLIPDILSASSYTTLEACDAHLNTLKQVLMREGLVRDFCNGGWGQYLEKNNHLWHQRGKEVVKKLVKDSRLVKSPAHLVSAPLNGQEWCKEAVASHSAAPLAGIIATEKVAALFPDNSTVGSIESLGTRDWWTKATESIRLARTTENYLTHLDLVLRHANSLWFIDPHLDPSSPRYGGFIKLLIAAKRAEKISVEIQLHRACTIGETACTDEGEWKRRFDSLDQPLRDAGLSAQVFIWDKFHDRHLISNLIGILFANGFDTTRNAEEKTTWARISRKDREDVAREFNSPNTIHKLWVTFRLGFPT